MMAISVIFSLVLVLCVSCSDSAQSDATELFMKFINDFHKPYINGTVEFFHRLEIFQQNLQEIERLNQPYEDGPRYGITQFSDLSPEEFRAHYLNDLRPLKPNGTALKFRPEKFSAFMTFLQQPKAQPNKIDWREKGVISAVKNQGSCGACWAFAAAETVESAYAIKFNTSAPALSVQQLIDCSTPLGNRGCEGGDICVALDYVRNAGITYESVYPLTNKDGTCHLPAGSKTVDILSYGCLKFVGQEDQLTSLVATTGPVAAAVDATTWHNYIGGIIKFHCDAKINHAVQIVGYDTTGSVPYYIVRNSWGTGFGDNGYLFIKIGENLCGIASKVADVTLKDT